jgi:hypothetical protein
VLIFPSEGTTILPLMQISLKGNFSRKDVVILNVAEGRRKGVTNVVMMFFSKSHA